MTDSADYETIILCGRCPRPDNLAFAELRARQLVWVTHEHITNGICPLCMEVVFFSMGGGVIDFGVNPPAADIL